MGKNYFFGSSRALKTDVGISGYSLAKFASLAYCKSLSKEYGSYGVTSNYIRLGLFKSPLLKNVKKKTLKKLLEETDTKSLGDFDSLKNALDFIIKSKYVTGSIIPVDGGFN